MSKRIVWEPLRDDHYGESDRVSVMRVGTLLEIHSKYGDGVDYHDAMIELPDNIRLCRAVTVEDTPAVTLTPEVREAIRYALEDGWDEYNQTLPEAQLHIAVLRGLLAETEATP